MSDGGSVLDLFGEDSLEEVTTQKKRHWGLNRDPAMKETIQRMYQEQGFTNEAISKILGVGITTVSRFRKEFDVAARTRPSEVGNVYGRLTVLSERRTGKGRGFISLCHCQCTCGKVLDVQYGNLQQGFSQSCGCLHQEIRSRPEGESMRDDILAGYKRGAKSRDLLWDLSDTQATNLFNGLCYYCGTPPLRLHRHGRCNGGYLFNGIDRQNNALGYTIANSVPACARCNMMKRCLSVGAFSDWAQRIVQGPHAPQVFPISDSQVRHVYRRYKEKARTRKQQREFDLTCSDVQGLIQTSCIYCGVAPSNLGVSYGGFRYSGIDRRDNTQGYIKENCQPACADCNRAKGTLSEEDFLTHVRCIAAFQQDSTSKR